MNNPADKRLTELLDKWLVSLDLHLKYSSLDEATYRRIQPWPDHDRPSRWIIELARQKATQLREALESRIQMGDSKFSDALELMAFLQNLVGSQHISRFIPLAEPQNEVALPANAAPPPAAQAVAPAPSPAAPAPAAPAAKPPAPAPSADATRVAALATQPRKALQETTATREMPRPVDIASTQSGRKTDTHRIEARKGAARREGKAAAGGKGKADKHEKESRQESGKSNAAKELKVVADAVRLLGWGRKWHELPELISRMADRPPVTEVRRILREQKEAIEAQSGSD